MELIIISQWRIKKDGAKDKNRFIFTLANDLYLQNIEVSEEQYGEMLKEMGKQGKLINKENKQINQNLTIYNFYIG